jgi:hypothetical protein
MLAFNTLCFAPDCLIVLQCTYSECLFSLSQPDRLLKSASFEPDARWTSFLVNIVVSESSERLHGHTMAENHNWKHCCMTTAMGVLKAGISQLRQ